MAGALDVVERAERVEAGVERAGQPPAGRVEPQRRRPGDDPDRVLGPDRVPVVDPLDVVPHAVAVDLVARRRRSAIASIRPSTCAGTPEIMCSGGSPSRSRGHFSRTRSWLPPIPPVVTITACACSSKSPAASRFDATPRARRARREQRAADAVDGAAARRQLVDAVAEAQLHQPLRDRLAHAPLERRDDARAGAPGDVEARHRVAVAVGEVAAALRPAGVRQPAHAHRVQPRPLLAGAEADVRLGPLARPLVLGPVERGGAEPVLQRQLVGVLDAAAPLLGAADEHQPAERPERLVLHAQAAGQSGRHRWQLGIFGPKTTVRRVTGDYGKRSRSSTRVLLRNASTCPRHPDLATTTAAFATGGATRPRTCVQHPRSHDSGCRACAAGTSWPSLVARECDGVPRLRAASSLEQSRHDVDHHRDHARAEHVGQQPVASLPCGGSLSP